MLRTVRLVPVVASLLLPSCGGDVTPDCSLEQGWTDARVAELGSNRPAPSALILGTNDFAAEVWPEVLRLDGGLPVGLAVRSSLQRLPFSVESVREDGGTAAVEIAVSLDGRAVPFEIDGSAFDAPPRASPSVRVGVLSVDGRALSRGVHDLAVVFTSRSAPKPLVVRWAWLVDSASWMVSGLLASGEDLPRVESQPSEVRTRDGALVVAYNSTAPVDGGFDWVAHVQTNATSCAGIQRTRLVALLDGTVWWPMNGQPFIDVEYPTNRALRVPLRVTGLPEGSHQLDVLMLDSIGRHQVTPAGTSTPWLDGFPGAIGSARW